jgi:hypothetical protein
LTLAIVAASRRHVVAASDGVAIWSDGQRCWYHSGPIDKTFEFPAVGVIGAYAGPGVLAEQSTAVFIAETPVENGATLYNLGVSIGFRVREAMRPHHQLNLLLAGRWKSGTGDVRLLQVNISPKWDTPLLEGQSSAQQRGTWAVAGNPEAQKAAVGVLLPANVNGFAKFSGDQITSLMRNAMARGIDAATTYDLGHGQRCERCDLKSCGEPVFVRTV